MDVKCFVCGRVIEVDLNMDIQTCRGRCEDVLKELKEKMECENVERVLQYFSEVLGSYKANDLINRYLAYLISKRMENFEGILKEVRRIDINSYEVIFYRGGRGEGGEELKVYVAII